MRRSRLVVLASIALAAGCGGADTAMDTTGAAQGDAGMPADTAAATAGGATATLRDTAGREIGTVTLTDTDGGIAVSGSLRGLPPGEHGFHIHTTGRCEPTFDAAGGHWNPTSRQHGSANPSGPHLGDMPNITVASDGTAEVQVTTPGGSLRGENALLDEDGAAVMVHASADDNRTDPTGNAGGRIACGVVGGT